MSSYTTMDILFICAHSVLGLFGVAGNTVLLAAIKYRSCSSWRSYPILLANCALIDLASCFSSALSIERMAPFADVTASVYLGPCSAISGFVCHSLHSIAVHTLGQSQFLIAISFYYRLYVMSHAAPSKRNMTIFCVIIVTFFSNDQPKAVRATLLLYHPDHEQFENYVVEGHVDINPHLLFRFVHAYLTLPIIPLCLLVFIIRRKLLAKFEAAQSVMTERTQEMQKSLVKVLSLQACLPILLLLSIVSFVLVKRQIYVAPFLEYSIFFYISIVPAVAPYISLYNVKPFRDFVFSRLRSGIIPKHVAFITASIVSGIPLNMMDAEVTLPAWSIVVASAILGSLLVFNCLFISNRQVIKRRKREHLIKKSRKLSSTKGRDARNKIKRSRKASTCSSKMTENSQKTSKRLSINSTFDSMPFDIKNNAEPWDEVATIMAMREPPAQRSLDKRIEVPMTEEEFMLSMKKVMEFITDQYRNPTKYPVATDIRPNDIFNQLPQRAPDNPERFDLVWNDFHEIILRGCIQWQHPRFHAFFPCGRSYPDILAETLISSLGTVGITWAANPAITELDSTMVNWLGRALGIPECFLFQGQDTCQSEGGGWLADTASDAILCAIMAARHIKVEQELSKQGCSEEDEDEWLNKSNKHTTKMHGKRAEIISKFVAYGSYESHSSFEKACKLACVRCRHIEVYEEDDWGMRKEEVEQAMEEDRQRGLIPFYLHLALGTTSTASSDHLFELTPLREKYGVWIHVDAAYAGSAWVVEKYRNNAGLEKVDSININLHKFFLTSSSITPFWTRRQRDYKDFFVIDPVYLKKKTGGNDLRNWGVQLTRRFKSLKVYMLLRVYGLNGMRAYVERIIGMTEYMESLIVKIPNIRKFGKTNYGLFCVQYQEDGMNIQQVNTSTTRLCEFINNSHKMVFTHSNVRGHDIIRVAVTLERSTKNDVEESVAIFAQLVEEFKSQQPLLILPTYGEDRLETTTTAPPLIMDKLTCDFFDRQTSSDSGVGCLLDEDMDIVDMLDSSDYSCHD